ncbi:hypothetical protein GLE_2941 [Lysobacter enzymogenes]|uniref:Uncharacterized protein n=1 Tax=Lysobacter enzymogenes TaxID=69 RepID=A0A0S2DIL3_LYSEN|nr:hypothetical protein GLE_2941 [Lysobacter enzymogenes]
MGGASAPKLFDQFASGLIASEPKASGLKALPQKPSLASPIAIVGGASAPTLFDQFAL